MTIFREEFTMRFVALFTALFFLKVYHWLMQDRVAYMEQTPAVCHGRVHDLRAHADVPLYRLYTIEQHRHFFPRCKADLGDLGAGMPRATNTPPWPITHARARRSLADECSEPA